MSILARAYNGSFDSVGFMLLVPLVAPPTAQSETQYHYPSTDTNTTIDMGKGMRNWEQKVAVDAADLSTLVGKVGGTHTYVGPSSTSYSSVKLKGVTTPIKAPGFTTYELTLQLSKDN